MNLPELPRAVVVRVVRGALAEDLDRGDVTTSACVDASAAGALQLTAREPLVVAGLDVVRTVFHEVDASLSFEPDATDGASLPAGASLARVSGRIRGALQAERVALNFLQRMCGTATLARRYVDAIPTHGRLRITDTRKTTPGLRALERYAVRCGGAHNHRDDLSAAVLIKDNHVAAAGGVRAAVLRARDFAPHTTRIECEVDSLAQLDEAIDAGVDIVLLDNFDDDAVAKAVAKVGGRATVEVSGGITLERIPALAALGVDVVSVGALTHSARAVDIGLDWLDLEATRGAKRTVLA